MPPSTLPPEPPPRVVASVARRPWLPRGLWWWILGAFALGLLLFGMLWWDQRHEGDFYKVEGAATADGRELPALPAPLPDDVMVEPPADALPPADPQDTPRIVESAPPLPPPPPPASTPMPAPAPASAIHSTDPVAISTPAPEYPRNAQRRGVGGTVIVRVDVNGRGEVESLDLERSSGDRELDRAALTAVRRWRFRPATRDGREVAASVRVPINFQARQ